MTPRVELIGRTVFEVPASMRPVYGLVEGSDAVQGTGQDLIEYAGRECYGSFNRPNPATASNAGYLRHILEVGHGSVLEHASYTLLFSGVSRSLTHELIRARHLSYCLAGDTKVYLDRPNRGRGKIGHGTSQTRTLAELWEMWQDRRRAHVKKMTIRTTTDSGVVAHGHIRTVAQSGVKKVYRITTHSGYAVKASADHLFWRPDGTFARLGDLSPGDLVMANGVGLLRDREWLTEQVRRGRTTPEIAALAGVVPGTVRKWRRAYDCAAPLGSGTVGVSPWNSGRAGTYTLPGHSEATKALLSEQKRGDANPAWKGGPEVWQNGRTAASQLWGHLRAGGCDYCAEPHRPNADRSNIELHHIDGNPDNNDRSNIAVVCTPCHKARHTGTPPMKTYPDEVVSIEYVGEEMTYDIEMDGPFKRFVANGLVVHNSQLSQRFVDSSTADYVLPEPGRQDEVAQRIHDEVQEFCLDAYAALVRIYEARLEGRPGLAATRRRKLVRQAARAVLPNQTETRIVVTGNLRAWRHFVHLRASEHADVEICELAVRVFQTLYVEAPSAWQDCRLEMLDDGTEVVRMQHAEEG